MSIFSFDRHQNIFGLAPVFDFIKKKREKSIGFFETKSSGQGRQGHWQKIYAVNNFDRSNR